MKNNGIFFGNHTWSHANVKTSLSKLQTEVMTAQQQLETHGLGEPRVFAYPFGIESDLAKATMNENKFLLAFDTKPGSTQCKQQRFSLRRIRIGNAELSRYGF